MIGKNRLESHDAILAVVLLILLIAQTALSTAQVPGNAPKTAGSAPSSFNPDRIAPNYPIPYGPAKVESVGEVLNRIHAYLEGCTPAGLVNAKTNEPVTDINKPAGNAVIEQGSFQIISYEWGVTYSGMLAASEVTGDPRFADYTAKRLNFLAELFPYYREQTKADPKIWTPLRSIVDPRSLDDSGSLCAAMIKAHRAGVAHGYGPVLHAGAEMLHLLKKR